jgi:DNA-binding transcriptional LysR family regulator
VDLDLAQVRAFVAVATELHFARAAARLFLSQQGLSKRIGRLEETLGVALFVRGPGRVALTDAGQRFLPHARRLLEEADAAFAASRPPSASPLRVDVCGHVHQPMRLVQDTLEESQDLRVDLSMHRNAARSIAALERGDIDVAFSNVDHLDQPVPAAIDHRLVSFERISVVAPADHPLGARRTLTAEELRDYPLWLPLRDSAPEVRGWFQTFAREYQIDIEAQEQHVGFEHVIRAEDHDGRRVALYGSCWPLPPDAAVRVIPLVDPVLLYPWSVLWLRANTHPRLASFITDLVKVADPWREMSGDRVCTGLPTAQ